MGDWCRRYCLKMLPVFLQTYALSLYQFYVVIPTVLSLQVATNLFVKHQPMHFLKVIFQFL